MTATLPSDLDLPHPSRACLLAFSCLLTVAARLSDLIASRSSSAHPAKVNAQNFFASTALHAAALQGLAPLVQTLIDFGGDVHAVNKEGITPVHLALNTATVKFLLDARADANAVVDQGRTPLEFADTTTSGVIVISGVMQYGDNGGDAWAHPPSRKEGDREVRELLVRRGGELRAAPCPECMVKAG